MASEKRLANKLMRSQSHETHPPPSEFEVERQQVEAGFKSSDFDIGNTKLTIAQLQADLKKIGFDLEVDGTMGPATHRLITRFKEGWIDNDLEGEKASGQVDLTTRIAISLCAKNDGRLSKHFSFREFRCRGSGDIRVRKSLIKALEKIRSEGSPLPIRSAYRQPRYNTLVGGTTEDRHLYGEAVDIPVDYGLTVAQAMRSLCFTGIGYVDYRYLTTEGEVISERRVATLDVRGIPPGSPGARRDPSSPRIWNVEHTRRPSSPTRSTSAALALQTEIDLR